MLAIVAIFFQVKVLSRKIDRNLLKDAFLKISTDLIQRNRLLSVVLDENQENEAVFIVLSIFAGTSHFVASKGTKTLRMKTTSIVLVDTIAALKIFESNTLLHSSFSKSNQLMIYIQSGTYDEIASMELRRQIVFHEYFIIEEETTIRLLTFVWYTPTKCKKPQLVEVNKFLKSTRRWKHGNSGDSS